MIDLSVDDATEDGAIATQNGNVTQIKVEVVIEEGGIATQDGINLSFEDAIDEGGNSTHIKVEESQSGTQVGNVIIGCGWVTLADVFCHDQDVVNSSRTQRDQTRSSRRRHR